MKKKRFKDRVVVVTGASRGLGRALAHAFAAEGANLVLTARHGDAVKVVADEVEKRGIQAMHGALDASNPAHCDRLVSAALSQFGHIDILVNNAAAAPPNIFLEQMPVDAFEAAMAANVRSVFLMTKAVLPAMRNQQWGRIVCISSGLGRHPMAYLSTYCVTKAAVNMLARAFAAELQGSGVLINAVEPGVFHSQMNSTETTPPEAVVPHILEVAALPDEGPSGALFSEGRRVPW